MKEKTKTILMRILQVSLSLACLLWVAFIFSNSLKVGEASTKQSSAAVEVVQSVAQVVAPDSKIATATGEDYDWLHALVRTSAHFTEFAVLGALLCGCYFSYTRKWGKIWLPILGVVAFPIIDEILQLFVDGRAGEFADFLVDLIGGCVGFALLLGILVLAFWIVKRKRLKAVVREDIQG